MDRGGRPTRPARRIDSFRHEDETRSSGLDRASSYRGGHYAESPIVVPAHRTVPVVVARDARDDHDREDRVRRAVSDGSRLHQSGLGGSRPMSRQSRALSTGTRTVSKVTRSKSLSSRPAGVTVYHTPASGQPITDMYAVEPVSRPATRMSSKSQGTTGTGKNTTKAGVVIETMSAPNPFCPNTRGVCCLMILVNLALILVAIGFIIVLQLTDPAFVWNIGIVILFFGFLTFLISLVYLMCICQESAREAQRKSSRGELYWTHHWQKNITIPELKSSAEKERWAEQDRFPEDDHDLSDSSSRDYPRLYLESDYGQRTDREADFETDREAAGTAGPQHHTPKPAHKSGKYAAPQPNRDFPDRGRR